MSLGIVLLIPSGFGLTAAETVGEAVGWLVCAAVIPVPMIVGGITLIRRVEDRQDSRADGVPSGPAAVRPAQEHQERRDWVGHTMERALAFDLNRLNTAGWLLLLATFGFVGAESFVIVLVLGEAGPSEKKFPRALAGVMIFLAIGFFVGMRWLLGQLGMPIYRPEDGGEDP